MDTSDKSLWVRIKEPVTIGFSLLAAMTAVANLPTTTPARIATGLVCVVVLLLAAEWSVSALRRRSAARASERELQRAKEALVPVVQELHRLVNTKLASGGPIHANFATFAVETYDQERNTAMWRLVEIAKDGYLDQINPATVLLVGDVLESIAQGTVSGISNWAQNRWGASPVPKEKHVFAEKLRKELDSFIDDYNALMKCGRELAPAKIPCFRAVSPSMKLSPPEKGP